MFQSIWKFIKAPIVSFPLLGISVGAISGWFYFTVTQLQGVIQSIAIFASSGLIIGLLLGGISNQRFKDFALSDIEVNVPHISKMKFVVNAEYKRVAWKLFIETITRISTQPLASDQGFLREALNSLYSLFITTRDLLQIMDPSTANFEGHTIEMLAIDMLNKELRPFLSIWHPLLSEFESKESDASERDWDKNESFRKELEELRVRILNYSYGFVQLAQVHDLETYYPEDFFKQGG